MSELNNENIVPGYYMNKTHWSSIYLDADVPIDTIKDIVRASHEWVCKALSKKVREQLGM
ncbi:MAG: MmcQ/YjbR family DNA-binding protein [Suipraeoptans sp.]